MKEDYKKTDDWYEYKYPRAAITTDCVIFGFDGRYLNILLVERGIEPFKGSWALPGGFLKMDERVEECAFRELKEETSLEPEQIEQFGVFSSLDRDPRGRVVTVAFYALVKRTHVIGGDDANDARWFPIEDLPPLAFDHKEIIDEAMLALKRDLHHQPIGFMLLDEQFSMPELQRLYEAILGRHFDRRNFQKKMMASGIVTPTVYSESTGHRPSKLFTFNPLEYKKMKEENTNGKEF